MVDVLTESCQSSGKVFYFYLHSALLPLVLLLLLPPLLPTLEAEEEEGTAATAAAEAACVEDVVAQSSEDFSVKKYKEKKINTIIARQHKFAHLARHETARFAICHGGTTVQQ